MSQILNISPPSAPFQEPEVIDKIDNDGHHYLKVLLLSNAMARNKWQAPYQTVGSLPKHVLDSFIGLPFINEHNHQFYDNLYQIMDNSNYSDEEIHKKLLDECNKEGVKKGHIDHIFMDDPNSSLLYGQLKITDPKENKYIQEHGRSSFKYTSPGIFGIYEEDGNGYKKYKVETMKPFHVASVPIPAFIEAEAKVRGVCSGNSDSCKRSLAYAGLEPSGTVTDLPTENLNSTCSCNKNIENNMSTNQQQQPPQVTTVPNTSTSPSVNTDGTLLKGSYDSTQEAIKAAREEAQRVLKEASTVEPQKSKQSKEEDNDEEGDTNNNGKDELSRLKAELRKYKQDKDEAEKRSLDQYNFFLDEILSVHIPKGHFKKEEEFEAEKNSMKAFINKYNVNLQDAKWLIIKSAKGIPNQNEEVVDNGKKKESRGNAYGGLLNNTTFSPDLITKPVAPKPVNNNSSVDEDDYPLGIV